MSNFNSADIAAFKDVWVFCEQREGKLMPTDFELISKGRDLADELGVNLCGLLLGGEGIESAAKELGVTPVSLEELLQRSDYVSVHCPLLPTTRHMFDREAFRKMKPTAVFINTARGAIVKEEDLVWALENGEIAMAGIDVTETEPIPVDHPLLKLPNALVTPHAAWYSEEAVKSLQLKVAQEVARVLGGEAPLHPVNHPKK